MVSEAFDDFLFPLAVVLVPLFLFLIYKALCKPIPHIPVEPYRRDELE